MGFLPINEKEVSKDLKDENKNKQHKQNIRAFFKKVDTANMFSKTDTTIGSYKLY